VSGVLSEVHAVASAAVAATQVGVAQRGLDMTVGYTKEREQFGRPIGSFQALKHRMAEMLVQVETARSASLAASVAVAERSADLARRTSVAKAWCSDALRHVAAETIQLHGGIAITWEHDAHLVLKRAHALGELFGPAHRHRAVVLEERSAG
jgi:alkylation response protein AidB-like acyl-CoA dehydrogenase